MATSVSFTIVLLPKIFPYCVKGSVKDKTGPIENFQKVALFVYSLNGIWMWFLQNETRTNRRHKGQVKSYVSDFTLHSLAPTVNTEIDERERQSHKQGGVKSMMEKTTETTDPN